MNSFKIYNCDFGILVDGVKYEFVHVQEVQIEDNERNRLVRGTNAKDKIGITYRDGLRDPKIWTIPILGLSVALKNLLDSCYEKQTRLEVYCIDRKEGHSKTARNAILANKPQQLSIDETAESMNVSLEFATFDSSEKFKES